MDIRGQKSLQNWQTDQIEECLNFNIISEDESTILKARWKERNQESYYDCQHILSRIKQDKPHQRLQVNWISEMEFHEHEIQDLQKKVSRELTDPEWARQQWLIDSYGDDHTPLLRSYQKIRSTPGSWTPAFHQEPKWHWDIPTQNKLFISMQDGSYQPGISRRLIIEQPKPDGTIKYRPLTMSPFTDKQVQEYIREIQDEKLGQDFDPSSQGFRAHLGVDNAIKELTRTIEWNNQKWVVEGDIKSCFDMIKHEDIQREAELQKLPPLVMDCLSKQIAQGWKEQGTEEVQIPTIGTPQGAILSPILCNMVLNRQDRFIRKEFPECTYLRYADDFIIGCDKISTATHIKNTQRIFMSTWLPISEPKTLISEISQGFRFQGYDLKSIDGRQKIQIPDIANQMKEEEVLPEEFSQRVEKQDQVACGQLERLRWMDPTSFYQCRSQILNIILEKANKGKEQLNPNAQSQIITEQEGQGYEPLRLSIMEPRKGFENLKPIQDLQKDRRAFQLIQREKATKEISNYARKIEYIMNQGLCTQCGDKSLIKFYERKNTSTPFGREEFNSRLETYSTITNRKMVICCKTCIKKEQKLTEINEPISTKM